MKKLVGIFLFLQTLNGFAQTGWMQVTSFGTNPGNLNMYKYIPQGITGTASLVVAMHGCTQNAITIAQQSGWNTMADRHKFYVIYPEQNYANNSGYCFNWFQSGDQDRNQGEAYSIKQMVDYMEANYSIDTTRIFVTGLSAGACMANVMLACYPEVFKKGAVMAGTPFKSATNATQAYNAQQGLVTNTPQNWASLVAAEYPNYTGSYPSVAVFHGSNDNVVNIANETEIMKQWTYLRHADQTADITTNPYNSNAFVTKNVYTDSNGVTAVETYTISGMGHAIALDTGSCYQQCGQTGTYAYEVYFSSTFFAAYFFDILIPAYSVSGPVTVGANQTAVTYSVPANSQNTFTWTVPPGASIASGQGTNQITVNFGTQSGYVEVTESPGNFCLDGPAKLFVTVSNGNVIAQHSTGEFNLLQSGTRSFVVSFSDKNPTDLKITNLAGQVVLQKKIKTGEELTLNDFPAGMYLVEIRMRENSQTKKIILE
jgi:poly(hydroxyalkanoate) depolymerase family esterase